MGTVFKEYAHSAKETLEMGSKLGNLLKKQDVVLLIGELGTGKTVFAKGIVYACTGANPDHVISPTFTLVQVYEGPLPVIHADLYRLNVSDEIFETGIDPFLETSVFIIEWGEKMKEDFENPYIVEIGWVDENKRVISVTRDI